MRGEKVTQIQKALAALYFYPDKGAKTTALTACMVRKQQMQLDDSSLCTGLLKTVFTDQKRKRNLKLS